MESKRDFFNPHQNQYNFFYYFHSDLRKKDLITEKKNNLFNYQIFQVLNSHCK